MYLVKFTLDVPVMSPYVYVRKTCFYIQDPPHLRTLIA